MPTPTLRLDEAKARIDAINQALRDGYRPPGHTGRGPGALAKAAADLGIAPGTLNAGFLKRAHDLHGLEPDWELFTPLGRALRPEGKSPALPPVAEHRLKRENAALKRQVAELAERQDTDERLEAFLAQAAARPVAVPAWVRSPRKTGQRQVLPVAPFSDWHLDEVVDPKQVNGRNAYNREIATRRLKRYFDQVCIICRDYVQGFTYPGIVFPMLGDIFSGNIHEELRNTNEDTTAGSLMHWVGPVAAGLELLAAEFGHVFVPVVVGNHGRNTHKPIAKGRVRDNFDWLFGQMLAQHFAKDRRFTFVIGESHKQLVEVFGTRILFSHGDECKGGSGIAGMLSPQLIAFSRMKKQFEFDLWVLGHWHHRSAYRGIRVNGAGKGFDEYAAVMNFDFQVPQQDLFFVAPGRGVIAEWPVFCQCDDEPWLRVGARSRERGAGKPVAFRV